ncbi:MAG: hypothetical protein II886_09920 [Prevotella sp.]|nr:hypothetical protein [Prevotella sp.]
MFCNQQRFDLPTAIVTAAIFNSLVDSAQTKWLTTQHRKLREALPSILEGNAELLAQWTGDENFQKFCQAQEASKKRVAGGKTKGEVFKALTIEKKLQTYCDSLKKSLPFVIFIATYIETVSASGKLGCWRKQAACRLNGLCVIDFDHINGDVREVWAEAYSLLSDEDKARVLLVYVTPSGHGLKVIFIADPQYNLIDNQKVFAEKLGGEKFGLTPDSVCRDASRGAFLTSREDILLINEEKLFTYENKDFGEKYNSQYRAGKSQPTLDFAPSGADTRSVSTLQAAGENQQAVSGVDGGDLRNAESMMYNGVSYAKIIEAWMEGRNLTNHRHDTLVELTDHLRYLIGKNPTKITEVVMTLPWVQDLAAEGEDVAGTVSSIMGWRYKQKKPEEVLEALRKAGAESQDASLNSQPSTLNSQNDNDVYAVLPLEAWAEELLEMAEYYPCLKELFLNVHPHKLPAVWFSSAALFGTLMTRAFYHFWYEPELVRRLNYCIFIIGDPGAGKNVIEKFYKKIADPMIQADQCLIDAVNRYKEGRTERTTSTKAQKGEALKKPVVGIRVHPARTATGEFIRHMLAAVETIQDKPLNLHMFSFDAELDNVTKQNKGGDWKDREILELKAFHNEEDGQMYANQESVTGMFNVFWNFIYTGTPYALHRKVNQRNFGTGMSTRLAVIPLPDKGMAKRHQQVDPSANETLQTWAYRLDKVEGELPIEPLNDETYEWQTSHLEIAEFNDDKADRTLLKRIPYYGIGISLPFILMRHWDEWQEKKTLTMDERDKRLCRLAMEIQYKCQQFYFGEMAYNYFADQNKEFVQRRRTTRYDDCFRKLPDEFKTQQFMDIFNCSKTAASRAIIRFQDEKVVEKVKYGLYRKVVQELP